MMPVNSHRSAGLRWHLGKALDVSIDRRSAPTKQPPFNIVKRFFSSHSLLTLLFPSTVLTFELLLSLILYAHMHGCARAHSHRETHYILKRLLLLTGSTKDKTCTNHFSPSPKELTPYWKPVPHWQTFSTCHTVRSQMFPKSIIFVSLYPYPHLPDRLGLGQHWEWKSLHQKWIDSEPPPATGNGPTRSQAGVATVSSVPVRSSSSLGMPR